MWCCIHVIALRGHLRNPVPAAEDTWWRVVSLSLLGASHKCVPASEGNPVVKRGSELEVTEEKGAAHKGENKVGASKPAASKVRRGARGPEGCSMSAVEVRGDAVVGWTGVNRRWPGRLAVTGMSWQRRGV